MAPGDLEQALCGLPPIRHPDLLVGLETHDDAGVFRLTTDLAVIQTVDFFTPIVDDPFTFGAIAAANALSDVYAMGGTPITAMNIVGFPMKDLPLSVLGEILQGGQSVLDEAGVLLVGGHSVKAPELLFGLSVLGRVHPDRVRSNAAARPGDVLILTKGLGTGVITTALKKGSVAPEILDEAVASMRRLNAKAANALDGLTVSGCTDVTGFGLVGHLHELALASGVDAELSLQAVPLLPGALEHSREGDRPGGLSANRAHFGQWFEEAAGLDEARVALLFDPQTSGGLIVCLPPAEAGVYLERVESHRIGELVAGTGRIRLRA